MYSIIKIILFLINLFFIIIGILSLSIAILSIIMVITKVELIMNNLVMLIPLLGIIDGIKEMLIHIFAIISTTFMLLGFLSLALGIIGMVVICCNVRGALYGYLIICGVILAIYAIAMIYWFGAEIDREKLIKERLLTNLKENFVDLFQLRSSNYNLNSTAWNGAMLFLNCIISI